MRRVIMAIRLEEGLPIGRDTDSKQGGKRLPMASHPGGKGRAAMLGVGGGGGKREMFS